MKSSTIYILILFLLGSTSNAKNLIIYNEKAKDKDSLNICEGIMSPYAMCINYMRNGKTFAVFELSEPVVVAQAEQKEEWGYFQFPSISKAEDGTLIVSWSMHGDTHKMYGKKANREMIPMISKDGGTTWTPKDKNYRMLKDKRNPVLNDGGSISVKTPPCKDIRTYENFPNPVGNSGDRTFYLMNSLPEDLQGIYVNIQKKGQKTQTIHAQLYDPGLLRYAIGSLMPIVWWGDMRQLADKSLVAGVYPGYYLDAPGGIMHNGVSFYKSEDQGHSWSILSRIPFIHDGIAENRGGKSFDEPAFEILEDSTFLCIMRSGSKSPMYKVFSYDKGKTWTTPIPFTPNGVKPKLLRLNNGVLVLVSGRPGVQIRFSLDGSGRQWTDPIDMMPFMKDDGSPQFWLTCGYASIIEADEKSFYIVYSNFIIKNNKGEFRKTILFRKVIVSI